MRDLLLEAVYLIVARGGSEARAEVRAQGGYVVLRELHLEVEDEGVRALVERIVDVLMGEEGEGEGRVGKREGQEGRVGKRDWEEGLVGIREEKEHAPAAIKQTTITTTTTTKDDDADEDDQVLPIF